MSIFFFKLFITFLVLFGLVVVTGSFADSNFEEFFNKKRIGIYSLNNILFLLFLLFAIGAVVSGATALLSFVWIYPT